MSITVDADIASSVNLFSKSVNDLQSNVAINGTVITGTSKYVASYPDFSSKVAEQHGNYLALRVDSVGADSVTVQVERNDGTTKDPVTLDDDRLIVLLLDNGDTIDYSAIDDIKVVSTMGEVIDTKIYTLDLNLETA